MKRAVLNAMQALGAFAPFRFANRTRALILTYHRFGESADGLRTSEQSLASQLKYLISHYAVIPLSELTGRISSGQELPPRLAAVTIDDGYSDAYEIAFPILRRYKVPATVFVVTDFVDHKCWLWTDKLRFLTSQTRATKLDVTINGEPLLLPLAGRQSRLDAAHKINSRLKSIADDAREEALGRIASSLRVELPHLPPDEYRAVDWDQTREMNAAGIEIGSHTLTHPILTRVSEARLRAELRGSKSRLEDELRRPVDMFCYPNGDYDAHVRQAVREAGYRSAVTIEPGLNASRSDALSLRRIHTEPDLARLAQSTSGFEQVKSRLRYVGARAMAGRASV